MTEILVGLIAILPALAGIANGRKRHLARIADEVTLHSLLKGDDFEAVRNDMRAVIAQSIEGYRKRDSRFVENVRSLAPIGGWLILLLGINLADGSVTDDESLEQTRGLAAALLIAIGGAIVLASSLAGLIGLWRTLDLWRLKFIRLRQRKKVRLLQQRVAELEADFVERKGEGERLRDVLTKQVQEWVENARQYRERGLEPPIPPDGLRALIAEFETTGRLDSIRPPWETDENADVAVRDE